MKLKYYLRGIAIGIIFTIVFMILTGANEKETMSDTEIIHAAKLLGMVESSNSVSISGLEATPIPEATPTPEFAVDDENGEDVTIGDETPVASTVDATDTPTPEPTSTPTSEPTTTPTPTLMPVPTTTPEPTATSTPEPTATPIPTIEPTKAPESSNQTQDQGETISLTIVKGMYSEAISQAAYEVGLVENAADFDKYLNKNGFASNIHIGTYKIKKGATYYEIATKITTPQY